jgi:hypothetical protein
MQTFSECFTLLRKSPPGSLGAKEANTWDGVVESVIPSGDAKWSLSPERSMSSRSNSPRDPLEYFQKGKLVSSKKLTLGGPEELYCRKGKSKTVISRWDGVLPLLTKAFRQRVTKQATVWSADLEELESLEVTVRPSET